MAVWNKRDENFIKSANEIIAANMKDEMFGVSELADKMNMSRSTLHRRIRAEKEISVSQFIRNARLTRAMELLKGQSVTVAEAAFATGFRNVSYNYDLCPRLLINTIIKLINISFCMS